MKSKRTYTYILTGLLLFTFHCIHAEQCAFNLPPNEQAVINGSQLKSKTLNCKVKTDGGDNYHLLNFISKTNTSIVNNLILPEGTIMTLSFAALENDRLTFQVENNAQLGITNDSTEFIKLTCDQL